MWKAAAIATLGLGLAFAAAIALGGNPKLQLVAVAGLTGAGLLPLLLWFGASVEELLLLALLATLSLSVKVHPVFRAEHTGGAVGLRIALSDLLPAAIALLVLLRPHGRIHLQAPGGMVASVGAWLVFATISTFASADPELGLFQISSMIQCAALFLFLSNYVNTRRRLHVVFLGMLLGLTLQSGVTVAQWSFPGRFEFAVLGSQEQSDVSVSESGDVDLPDVDLGQTVVGGVLMVRPMGLLIHANLLAVFLVTQILVAACLAQSSPVRFLRWASAGAAALGIVALYASFSRSGWGVAVGGGALLLFFGWRRRAIRLRPIDRVVAVLVVAVLAGVMVRAAPAIWLRLTETAGEAVSFRGSLNEAALRIWADNPVTGVGLNTFIQHVAEYDASGLSRIKAYPVHNIFLLELSEAGVGALAAILAFAFFTVRETWRRANACQGTSARLCGIALFAGVVCFWVADLFAFSFRVPVMAGLLWSLVAVSIANQTVDAREGIVANHA
ncbi:MAG: O-antigen ligase family protein [Pirellulaceae bacterium]|nr:O-antigen ligase family protein [Pirellulaceae bacterium]